MFDVSMIPKAFIYSVQFIPATLALSLIPSLIDFVLGTLLALGEYRNKGCANACLDYAKGIAVAEGCYRIFLLTGSKEKKTLELYEHAGYSRYTKTAFQQELL